MRSAGILLPVTALPGGYGVGTLGAAARQFLDFLQAGGQRVWQLLPLGPTGFGDSPYQCFSSFAGNPYLIDLDDLCRDGLLEREEYAPLDWGRDPGRVDYGLLYRRRFAVLEPAARRARERFPREYAAYCKAQAAWLPDYALFMALKDYQGGVSWD
ncbi:MAG: 4-alpha-glucanotransferase, partial [Oscillospiraceae bacterium]|nr:4-alpha-glucanotransferase [Oscillospiraceae bacterium]